MDFNQLLILLAQKKGSDLFVTSGRPPSIKIDGVIRPVGKEVLIARVKALLRLRARLLDYERRVGEATA